MSRHCTIGCAVSLACVMATEAFPNIVGYWRFEDVSGKYAADQTGRYRGDLTGFENYNPGNGDIGYEGWSTNVSSPTVPLTGSANNGSIRMQGGGEYVDLSNGQDMYLGKYFTIEFYMKPDDPGGGSSVFGFSPISELYLQFFREGDGTLSYQTELMTQRFYGPLDFAISEWQHFAFVKTPGEYALYLNGIEMVDCSVPSSTDGPYWFPGTDYSGDRTIGGDSGTWRGWIDEFRISDEALTPDRFLNAAVPEPGTIGLLGLGGLPLWFSKPCKTAFMQALNLFPAAIVAKFRPLSSRSVASLEGRALRDRLFLFRLLSGFVELRPPK